MPSGNFVDPQQFPPDNRDNPQGGQNKKDTGYPKDWQKPHWHGDDMYNPHLICYMNAPDGTRFYYDPVTGTHSKEYRSGEHMAHLQDGHIHTVPGRRLSFTGSGGHSEAIGGHHDYHVAGHQRTNIVGDTYENNQGSHVKFVGGNHGHIVAGNQYHHVGKNLKFAAGTAIGLGVAEGSDEHAMVIGMTADRTYFNAVKNGDMYMQTKNNHVNIQSGKSLNITTQENVSISAQGQKITIKGGKIYLTGNVMLQGDLQVSGKVQASDIVSPTSHITNMLATTGSLGSGQAPTLNNPSPASLDSGKVSDDA